jgi:hypothetical protein
MPGGPDGPGAGAESFSLKGKYLLWQLDSDWRGLATFPQENQEGTLDTEKLPLTQVTCDGTHCGFQAGDKGTFTLDMYHQNVLLGTLAGHPVAGRRIDDQEYAEFSKL